MSPNRVRIFFLLVLSFSFSAAAKDNSPIYADRYYLSSVLVDIFGPEAKDKILSNILKNANIFGGPCDIYEQIRIGPQEYINPVRTRCFNSKRDFIAATHAKNSLIRESWMLNTCSALVSNKTTYNFFMNKISHDKRIGASFVTEVQSQFDPNYFSNEKLNKDYLNILKKPGTFLSNSKKLIFHVCISPFWQLI